MIEPNDPYSVDPADTDNQSSVNVPPAPTATPASPPTPEDGMSGIPPRVPLVACYELTKSYAGHPALNGIDLELPQGQIIGLLGPNGSGKTTLVKILAGLLQPTSGTALIDGRKPDRLTKAHVAYLPDRTYLEPHMRVSDCMKLFSDFYTDFDLVRAHELLSVLNISLDARLKSLSKGTREKVQLILVMARHARLYLLDEPIGGVDPAARDFILGTILKERDPNATVLLSTHLISDVENVLDGFVFMNEGRVLASGAVNEARDRYGKTLDELFREVFRCF